MLKSIIHQLELKWEKHVGDKLGELYNVNSDEYQLVLFYMAYKTLKICLTYNDYFEIPKEHVTKDKLFSKTMIKYAGLKSVSYLMPDQVDDDCTGSHGSKVPCIKFTDDKGEVYRMKVEYFSEKQALEIIDQVKQYMSID